jgi:precorrin-6A/cobalt-precorrin-6A reductase
VLILGGTGEARALALGLAERPATSFESSLAGRVTDPALPVGEVRIGGFGGSDGLAQHLLSGGFDAVIDATHPFAATITSNAVKACATTGRPLVVLRRPGWEQGPDDDWAWTRDIEEAAALVAASGPGVELQTTGRRDLAAFAADSGHHYVVRTVDRPAGPTPARMTLLLDRGPYLIEGERALMRSHHVRRLVTKDSGGAMTAAKLAAARELALPVIVVRRPALPQGAVEVRSVAEAIGWLADLERAGR